jgi:hypothetical protein
MPKNYYTFDPAELDGSQDDNTDKEDLEEEKITLDNWKPTKKEPDTLKQSEWRKLQNGNNFNQEPGIDELKKIEMYLKKKKADAEIMNAFGINAETLIAIKRDKYCPVHGIHLDNLSKIYQEFKSIDQKISYIKRATHYLGNVLFIEQDALEEYKYYCKTGKMKKKGKEDKKTKNTKDEDSALTVKDE